MKAKSKKSGLHHAAATDRKDVAREAKGAAVTDSAIDPKWAWHYRTLVALRARLARDTAVKLRDAAEPLEPHSQHPGDSATDEFDHDLALAILAAEQNALNEVSDAIHRIERGTYGVCEATEAVIPEERLRAVPWCRYTYDVEKSLERAGSVPRARLTKVVSLRGARPHIPAEEDLPIKGATEGEEIEPEETKTAKIIRRLSSLDDEAAGDSKSPFGDEPGPGQKL